VEVVAVMRANAEVMVVVDVIEEIAVGIRMVEVVVEIEVREAMIVVVAVDGTTMEAIEEDLRPDLG
jgi:hypothetical protein